MLDQPASLQMGVQFLDLLCNLQLASDVKNCERRLAVIDSYLIQSTRLTITKSYGQYWEAFGWMLCLQEKEDQGTPS
jgi:hypothetical protein